MKTMTFVSASLIALVAGTSALAIDLTTNSVSAPSAIGRYTVCGGYDWGETIPYGWGLPAGVAEYLSCNQWASWWIVDGNPDTYTTTYNGTSPEFMGYRFKLRAATVTGLYWDTVVFWDGGTFATAPAIQYQSDADGPWQTVPAANVTWVEPYNTAFSDPASHRTYHINIDPPLTNVWGIRLYGNASPGLGGDVDGFVGVAELAVYGTPDLGDLDLSRDLTVGGTAIMSAAQSGHPEFLIDQEPTAALRTYETTYGGFGERDYMGVTWSTAQYRVKAMGVFFQHFNDGGYFADDCLHPLSIEYTTDGGSTWNPVVGLHKGRYTTAWRDLATTLFDPDTPFLFTFDELNGINGLRIIGWPAGRGGDTDGFVAAWDLDVFGGPLTSRIVNYDNSTDSDVDATDFGLFLQCWSGPKVALTPDCTNRDLDHDGDVDEADFGLFQRCFSGNGVAPNPLCGEGA